MTTHTTRMPPPHRIRAGRGLARTRRAGHAALRAHAMPARHPPAPASAARVAVAAQAARHGLRRYAAVPGAR
ncbi:hypothetical protein [Burkholderia sp. lig30]|uniref:hypothetical protein n=1 Tax=Burkholderia sp. lig30 TaxID=1192124 RepID=UPI00057226FD|nr:hypothetical protein [Burkholderia sp. lig30]